MMHLNCLYYCSAQVSVLGECGDLHQIKVAVPHTYIDEQVHLSYNLLNSLRLLLHLWLMLIG